MKRCFELAELGKGTVAPNPTVGAVLVYNNRIIGEGWHQQYGQAHAEVNCLNNVSVEDKHLISESTMYVNLEPCAHQGKTPSCALKLIEEKIKKVVIANVDPFKEVAGKGIKMLNNAGIETRTGLLKQEGKWLNRRFFCFYEKQRPYIILKWAQTANGFFAPLDRGRYQISNKHSNQLLHKWRTEEAAIMVGYTTAKNDDPELTARSWKGKNPLRIVLGQKLELDNNSKLFNDNAKTWIVNNEKDETEENVNYMKLDFSKQVLPQLMERMYSSGIQSLIVEGGAMLLQSFIDEDLWDEARVFEAGSIIQMGIVAPTHRNAKPAFSSVIDTDKLHVYTHSNTSYSYIKGCQL